jgi:D-3-phosphoglycerate dehydrogenase
MVSLETLLSESDVLSLHVPLSPQTHHILDADAIRQLKRNCVIINTSRGGLIDHDALWEAIQSERVAGAALDVYDPEPPDLSHPMFHDERMITTPHAAFRSTESLVDLRTRTAHQIRDLLEGRRPQNIVNPEALSD